MAWGGVGRSEAGVPPRRGLSAAVSEREDGGRTCSSRAGGGGGAALLPLAPALDHAASAPTGCGARRRTTSRARARGRDGGGGAPSTRKRGGPPRALSLSSAATGRRERSGGHLPPNQTSRPPPSRTHAHARPLALSPLPPPGPYEGGTWKLHVELPEAYPYKSPSIGFVNRIYHPNVDEVAGSVCLDVINQTWSPMFDLLNVFETFLPQLLLYPNPADPLNGEAAALLMREPAAYAARVREYVRRYATRGAADGRGRGADGGGGGAGPSGAGAGAAAAPADGGAGGAAPGTSPPADGAGDDADAMSGSGFLSSSDDEGGEEGGGGGGGA